METTNKKRWVLSRVGDIGRSRTTTPHAREGDFTSILAPVRVQPSQWEYGGRSARILPSVAEIMAFIPPMSFLGSLAPISPSPGEQVVPPLQKRAPLPPPLPLGGGGGGGEIYDAIPVAEQLTYEDTLSGKIRSMHPRQGRGYGRTIIHLKDNVYVHRDESDPGKRFPCPACTKRFHQAEDMRRHYRVHSGERPLKCPLCTERFTQPGHLEAHRRRHTDTYKDAPYRCLWAGCTCGFLRRRELLRHVKTGHDIQ